jgi:plastocyanin
MDNTQASSERPLWPWIVGSLLTGLLAVFGIYYFFFKNKQNYLPNITAETLVDTNVSTTDIAYGAGGFAPQNIVIDTGQTVTWSNNSGIDADVSSSPHPTHTDYPPLNLGTLSSGSTLSLTFTSKGIYKYHNHLNPSQFGTITVE